MANEALSQIKEAEAQAQALVRSAQEEAARNISRAEEETADAFSLLNEKCALDGAQKKQQAEASARTASAAFAEETAYQCVALKQELLAQKSKAVHAVVKSVAGGD